MSVKGDSELEDLALVEVVAEFRAMLVAHSRVGRPLDVFQSKGDDGYASSSQASRSPRAC
jgi:hypothetical protein